MIQRKKYKVSSNGDNDDMGSRYDGYVNGIVALQRKKKLWSDNERAELINLHQQMHHFISQCYAEYMMKVSGELATASTTTASDVEQESSALAINERKRQRKKKRPSEMDKTIDDDDDVENEQGSGKRDSNDEDDEENLVYIAKHDVGYMFDSDPTLEQCTKIAALRGGKESPLWIHHLLTDIRNKMTGKEKEKMKLVVF